MAELLQSTRARVQSIDILRGVVMVIMALDHTRDFFHKIVIDNAGSVATGPTDMATTTPVLFFTRWITHYCAPIFVFLAGTSVYLMTLRKTKQEISVFLIKRGFWLVLVEVIIVTFGWTFDPLYHLFILQVIWAIGVSMILLGLLIWLPYSIILLLGLVIVFGHNLLDYSSISTGLNEGPLANLLYFSKFAFYRLFGDRGVIIVYAFLPWTGVMLLGYCLGRLYGKTVSVERRRSVLLFLGIGLTAFFIILRLVNKYGDPFPWEQQPRGGTYTFLSFLNVNKYPPSLAFLTMTIGPGLILLALFENVKSRIAGFFKVFGRVPLFYYVLHFYLLHLIVVIVFFVEGFPMNQIRTDSIFLFRPSSFGFGLWGVYLVWIIVILVLYPLCKKYDRYKTANLQRKWWLSYL